MKRRELFDDMAALVEQRQDEICEALCLVEPSGYQEDLWDRPGGGGGKTRIFTGNVIEKGGVNTSQVFGQISQDERPMFARLVQKVNPSFELTDQTEFSATGISLVLHPVNPMVPTVHANYRYFEIQNGKDTLWWFGGGADLTPYYLFQEDARHFHSVYQDVCNTYKEGAYSQFKKKCDDYFYIPHRGETRGVGGIFFDYLHDDHSKIFEFVSQVSDAFIESYLPILERRQALSYTDQNVKWQRIRRGRYAEFNLVYDRGTLFGLQTRGRIESVLMSMPPQANWVYDYHPKEGSLEAELQLILKNPIEWV